jgi:hypothetical protein
MNGLPVNPPTAAHIIGGAIIENPCGMWFITPHGFVFIRVDKRTAVASGEIRSSGDQAK